MKLLFQLTQTDIEQALRQYISDYKLPDGVRYAQLGVTWPDGTVLVGGVQVVIKDKE